MQSKKLLTTMTGLSVAFSSSLMAHIDHSSTGLSGMLLHPFTSIDHVLTIVLAGVVIVYFIKKKNHPNE